MPDKEAQRQFIEHQKCAKSPAYFIHHYCYVENKSPDVLDWIPFRMWPAQRMVLAQIAVERLVSILKARQLGLSWLIIAYVLWLLIFRPGSQVLMFSRRDAEAKELLQRIKGMHERLPSFLRPAVTTDNDHELAFGGLNSTVKSFPTTKDSGRSYTASLVIIDEADFIPWLKQLITAVKPTVDAGGQLIMISTANKERPQSEFKRLWKNGRDKLNSYRAIFLAWYARPDRTAEWYEAQKRDYEEDDLFQEYPETPEQALAPRSANMRFKASYIQQCTDYLPPLEDTGPAIPGLSIYERPRVDFRYIVAIDTSEGDATSDPSPATVLCMETWQEVAHLYGRFEPAMLAGYSVQLAHYFNNAVIVPERNNHGHAVILAAKEIIATMPPGERPLMYINPFDKKPGWLSNMKFKTLALDLTAQALKDQSVTIRTEATAIELTQIEAATGAAVTGETDDRAMSFIIGLAALKWPMKRREGGGLAAKY